MPSTSMKSPAVQRRCCPAISGGSPSGFGIEHQFNEVFKGIVSVGGVFNRQLGYKDDVGKVAPETGFYTSARLTASF